MSHADEIRSALASRSAGLVDAVHHGALKDRAIALAAIVPSLIGTENNHQRAFNVQSSAFIERRLNPPRSPLEDAANDLQMAVADFYVLLDRAKTSDDITAIWTQLQQMESLISACASAAGRKADAL